MGQVQRPHTALLPQLAPERPLPPGLWPWPWLGDGQVLWVTRSGPPSGGAVVTTRCKEPGQPSWHSQVSRPHSWSPPTTSKGLPLRQSPCPPHCQLLNCPDRAGCDGETQPPQSGGLLLCPAHQQRLPPHCYKPRTFVERTPRGQTAPRPRSPSHCVCALSRPAIATKTDGAAGQEFHF